MFSGLDSGLSAIFFFFNDTATTEIYTLSLHDALPICRRSAGRLQFLRRRRDPAMDAGTAERHQAAGHADPGAQRSEEHTSELQSRLHLVCRLLLEKKKQHARTCARHVVYSLLPLAPVS